MADCPIRHRDCAVRAEAIGVKYYDRLAVERRLPVEHVLMLQPGIFPEKIPGAGSAWHGIAWVVPQLAQPRFDKVPGRHSCEQCRGQPLLRLQPGVRLWSLRVFQPAIGIGYGRAVVVVDHRVSAGGGIEELWGRRVRMVGHLLV